jgi:hypothetical protein
LAGSALEAGFVRLRPITPRTGRWRGSADEGAGRGLLAGSALEAGFCSVPAASA